MRHNRLTPATTLCLGLCLCLGLLAYNIQAETDSKKKDKVDDGWVCLMPEKDMAGWSTKNKHKYWKLEEGKLVGENADKAESRLWTDKDYGDYELIVEYKDLTKGDRYDSGVFTRGNSHQVQIGISGSLRIDLTACIYCPIDGNGAYPQQEGEKVKEAHKLGEWNTLRIITKGKNIKTYLNGKLINDYDGVKYPDKGKIGLQLHSGMHMKMAFKTVKIREIGSE